MKKRDSLKLTKRTKKRLRNWKKNINDNYNEPEKSTTLHH